MRQPNSASCKNSCLLKVCRLILLVLAGWMFMPKIGVAAAVIALHDASYVISDSSSRPPDVPGWSKVALPHRSARPAGQDLTGYWYRLTFDTPDTSQPLWLLFPKLRSGGTVYLNGLMIGKITEADLLTQRRWFRPYMFLAPPVALQTAGNEILVHFTIREPLTSFGEVLVRLALSRKAELRLGAPS